MTRRILIAAMAILAVWSVDDADSACAQGLIWNLPAEEGAWVRYEGTYKQTEIRSDAVPAL